MNKIKKSNIRFGDKLEYLIENHTITLEDGTAVKPGLGKNHTIPTILVQDFYRHGIFKYKNVVHDKNGNEKTHAQQCNDKKRIMQKHLDNEGSVSADWIMYYCHYFQCEPDFLFGYIDNPTHAITDTSYYLGLDGQTVELLSNYPDEIKDLLNRLILNKGRDNLLKLLQAMYTYSDGAHHASVRLDITGESTYNNMRSTEKLMGAVAMDGYTLPDISKKMLKYSVTSTLDEVLTDSYNNYIEDGNKRLKERYDRLAAGEKARWKRLHNTDWRELSIEEKSFLMGESWGDKAPTEDERFTEIDRKYETLYEMNKEQP